MKRTASFACLMAMTAMMGAAFGQDVGAKKTGNWTGGTSIWTGGGTPGASNNVYIGSSNHPSGAASSATVTLTQNVSASNLYLGYGSGTSGTLKVNGNALLTISGSLTIGTSGGVGSLAESNGGSFSAGTLNLYGTSSKPNALVLGSKDVVTTVSLSGAKLTTAATGNVNGNVTLASGSTLALGAAMNLGTNTLDVEGKGSTLNMNSKALTAGTLSLGWGGGTPVNLSNRGALNLGTLDVVNAPGHSFNINGGDKVGTFNLSGGSTTLNANVASLNLSGGATATTTTQGNVTGGATVASGSTLKLGASMNVGSGGTLDVEGKGSTLNMNSKALTAGTLSLGWGGGTPVNLSNRGALNLGTLNVVNGSGQSFDIKAGDQVGTFNLGGGSTTLHAAVTNLNLSNGAAGTTTAAGNVNGGATVASGSTLKLGAAMNLGGGTLDVEGKGSTLDAHGFSVSAGNLQLGYSSGGATGAIHLGPVSLNNLDLGNNSGGTGAATLTSGTVRDAIQLQGGSTLTVQETGGTGLTLDGSTLSITGGSHLVVDLTGKGWGFRWLDPAAGGNWVSTLKSMVADGQIVINAPHGAQYEIIDPRGYTGIQSVPEPSSLWLTVVVGGGGLLGIAYRRRRDR
jgi:hypothetical protein